MWFLVIPGDVGLRKMGLSEEDYVYLSTEVDFIIHTAAYVNLIYPYPVRVPLHIDLHWNENVLLTTFSSLAAPKIVKMTKWQHFV